MLANHDLTVREFGARLLTAAKKWSSCISAYDITNKKGNRQRIKGFKPIAGARVEILILGSMPGHTALQKGEYYAHPRNAFWPIMGHICGAGPELPYAERIQALTAAGIGIWNVIDSCFREGSLD